MRCSQRLGAQDVTSGSIVRFLALDIAVGALAYLGYDGPIFATPATTDLCSVMLPDSAHIQESEVDQLNRRNLHRGRQTVTPIYTARDAAVAITLFRQVRLGSWEKAGGGIRFRFWNAGHLLGSASVEMEIGPGPSPLRLLFSGDIGPRHKLLQFDATAPSGWDYVAQQASAVGRNGRYAIRSLG